MSNPGEKVESIDISVRSIGYSLPLQSVLTNIQLMFLKHKYNRFLDK